MLERAARLRHLTHAPWPRSARKQELLLQEQERFGKTTFLVYSMGKVGSTTVYDTLREHVRALPVAHAHFLSDYWVKGQIPSLHRSFHRNIGVARRVRKRLASFPEHRVKIVTLVRDPLARELSDVFENWKGLFPIRRIDDLTYDMVASYLDGHDHAYALGWFDTEFRNWTSLDIYAQAFDRERGYCIYRDDRFDVLVLKLEQLGSCLPEAMGEFAGIEIAGVKRSNPGETKAGRSLHEDLRRTYRPTREKLGKLYGSKLVTHFYSDAEIVAFKQRWSP